ncbi:MAG: PilN domain-containing protein [Acidiferrobacterales bacterium]
MATHVAHNLTHVGVSLRRCLRDFTHWWGMELLALVPMPLRDLLQRRTRRLIVDVDGRNATLTLCGLQGARTVARLALGAGEPEQALAEALDQAGVTHIDDVAVRVPAERALRTTLTLPLAADENLRQVLAFEMDRHTPFRAEQVYYDVTVTGRDPVRRCLRVVLTLLPRTEVDPLLQALSRCGLEPSALDVINEDGASSATAEAVGLNLLPPESRRATQGKKHWPTRALAGLATVLVIVAGALPFVQKVNVAHQLEARVEQAKEKALSAQRVRKELEQLVAQANTLIKKRKEQPSAIRVVDELTRILPDSTWLNRLELAGVRVKIQGESANASRVATLMEDSALFTDARFDAPVTRNPRTEKERFLISAKVKRTSE